MVERYTVAIRELPDTERPRERLKLYGPQALSDKELLAIQLRIGTRELSALGLAEHLLKEFRGLGGIARAHLEDLKRVKGVGEVKAIEIAATVELGRRIMVLEETPRPKITSPRDVANLLMPELRYEAREHFKSVLLDTKNQVIKICSVSTGTLDCSLAHPREVFREAIIHNAAAIIAVHNHPSGDPTPSVEDRKVTERLLEAGKIVGIELLDHIVIGAQQYISFKERGWID